MPSSPARVRSAAHSFLTASHRTQRPHRSHGHTHRIGSKSLFSTSSRLSYATSREPSLYEILDVPVTASLSEIKKYVAPPPTPQPGHTKKTHTHRHTHTHTHTRERERGRKETKKPLKIDNSTPSPFVTTQIATAPIPPHLPASLESPPPTKS